MRPEARSRRLGRLGLLLGFALWAVPSDGDAQTLYDYATRSPGSDIWAYDGESDVAPPTTMAVPSTGLSGGEYNRIAANDGSEHVYTVSTNNRYGLMRFEIRIAEAEADVGRLDFTWNGRGVNQNNGRLDGASLYVWNWAASVYELVQAGPDTEAEVTLTGSRTANLIDYIGGAAEDTVLLLVASNDRKLGVPQANSLGTDYVSLGVAAGANAFVIAHDGAGIHCLAETIGVTAVDALGAVLTTYAGTITLDTQTGTGTWSNGPGNNGSFNDAIAGDGLATYTFDPADNGTATFLLDYAEGIPIFDIDVWESGNPAVRDDDTEGLIGFAPSGFTVTASALPNPPPNPISDAIGTQTAGTAFDLHIAAYGQTPTDPTCGVIESYTGAQNLAFWSGYSDPAAGTLTVSIDGAAIATSEAGAIPQAVNFVNGQAVVTAKYKDVGEITIGIKDESVAEPVGGIRGGTGPFVVQPAEFEIAAIERLDATPNPGATTPAGPVFVAAGTPFRVRVRVLDAEGDLTPNYGNEVSAEGIEIFSSTLVAPVGGRNGTADDGSIGNGVVFTPVAPAGTFEGDTFYWDEVGAIRLRAHVADADYLGSGDVTGSESGDVGRFTPDHFDVLANAPELATACPAGGFTYLGQSFDYTPGSEPELTVTARNAQNTTTANYTGAWFRITAASLGAPSYAAAVGTLGVPVPNPPTIVDAGGGIGTIRFDTGPPQSFVRTTLVGPFDADIGLAVNVIDEDGVAYAGNPALFGQPIAGAGIAFSTAKTIRFGRLVIENAHDSELVTLPVPLYVQYWNGSAFLAHTSDGCTALVVADLRMTPVPPGLPTVPTIANTPLVAGDAGLSLSPPGAGNTGYVDLEFDLSTATGAALPWLRYDWDGDTLHDDNPTGRATFGIYAGAAPIIYLRELY